MTEVVNIENGDIRLKAHFYRTFHENISYLEYEFLDDVVGSYILNAPHYSIAPYYTIGKLYFRNRKPYDNYRLIYDQSEFAFIEIRQQLDNVL